MSAGMVIYDGSGQLAFGGDGEYLSVLAEGQLVDAPHFEAAGSSNNFSIGHRGEGRLATTLGHYKMIGPRQSVPYGVGQLHYSNTARTHAAMAFVKPGTNGVLSALALDLSDPTADWTGTARYDIAPLGKQFLFDLENDVAMDYFVTDINPPPATGTHGIQLFDAQGSVTFDSRHRKYAIFHQATVSQTDAEAILLGSLAYVDITLPSPAPNAFICIHHLFTRYYRRAMRGGNTFFNRDTLRVRQTNDVTFRVDRKVAGSADRGPVTTQGPTFASHDLHFFFSRGPHT